MKYTWKTKTGQYQNGKSLYLNRICVGSCDWNGCRSRNSDLLDHYVGNIFLPSLKNERVFGDSEEEVKAKVESTVESWFKEALKELK